MGCFLFFLGFLVLGSWFIALCVVRGALRVVRFVPPETRRRFTASWSIATINAVQSF